MNAIYLIFLCLIVSALAWVVWLGVARIVRRKALLFHARQTNAAKAVPLAEDASEESQAASDDGPQESFIGSAAAVTPIKVDALLVGGGAMSTTLGMLLHQLDPSMQICLVEQLDQIAMESTDALNNAGTGHAGYCELNYTPMNARGDINTDKAFRINSSFEVSLEYWSSLVEAGLLPDPGAFIHQVPHLSFVIGEDDINFLRKRHEVLSDSVAFGDMKFSDDREQIAEWIPLFTEGRSAQEKIAATRVRYGADVNFGVLAREMAKHLASEENFEIRTRRTVTDLVKKDDGRWLVDVAHHETGSREVYDAEFVFLGAGGGALSLLQKSGIPEGRGYGGFPVGGQWLICEKPEIIAQHRAKVYGKAAIGAPPMSVPHLDTRHINGKQLLLFGPYAGYTTRFLKRGSLLDLIKSLTPSNLWPMITVGWLQKELITYLVGEVIQSHHDRCDTLRRFFTEARDQDWKLEHAGKRVQIIKRQPNGLGMLQFGTEVVSSNDGSLSALLGASPGASTAVKVMLDVLADCFPKQMASSAWKSRLKELIPSYGEDLLENDELFRQVRQRTLSVLKLDELP